MTKLPTYPRISAKTLRGLKIKLWALSLLGWRQRSDLMEDWRYPHLDGKVYFCFVGRKYENEG